MKIVKFTSLLVLIVLFLGGCAQPKISPKSEPIKMNIVTIEQKVAKKMFLNEFKIYLHNTPWVRNWGNMISKEGRYNDFKNSLNEYDFKGVQESIGKNHTSTLFLYKDRETLGGLIGYHSSLIILDFANNSYMRAVYIAEKNIFALIVSNSNVLIANGEIKNIFVGADGYWSITYDKRDTWDWNVTNNEAGLYLRNSSQELGYKATVFAFQNKRDLNHFASVLKGAFPIIKSR